MAKLKILTVTKSADMPQMQCRNFFHSVELFNIAEQTPRHSPIMIVAENEDGEVKAHMLAIVRRRGAFFTPHIFSHARVYGEGEYDDDVDREQVFAEMLLALTRKAKRRLCLYVEFSELSSKMFGYKHFRRNKYTAVRWQEVHNSLSDDNGSKVPGEGISEKMLERIEASKKAGVKTRRATEDVDINGFYKLLRSHNMMKVSRFIPQEKLFVNLASSDNVRIFITEYKNKIIGGSACAYSEGNAYMWYLASKRKTYLRLHPDIVTVWEAINYAQENNYAHIYFLDAGLPLKKSSYREFILSFGGKPVTKYRWFRFFVPWVNRLIGAIYSN